MSPVQFVSEVVITTPIVLPLSLEQSQTASLLDTLPELFLEKLNILGIKKTVEFVQRE